MRTTDACALARELCFPWSAHPGPVLRPVRSELLWGEAVLGAEVQSHRERARLASGTHELHWRAHTHSPADQAFLSSLLSTTVGASQTLRGRFAAV